MSDGKQKIAVALSGGVDSAVCCRLLQEEYDVLALFMDLGQPDLEVQRHRVTEMAAFLGVELQIVDLCREFEQHVLHYFTSSYGHGLTPNPCVVCNPTIKCGLLLEAALAQGCVAMATGHYVRMGMVDDVAYLRCGVDSAKDQSYFLCGLNQHQLRHLRFPLGAKLKSEVYALAEGFDLPVRGGESQDICFLQGSLADFLEQHLDSTTAGAIVDSSGRELGRHQGIQRYTIGQRRGLGLPAAHPLYVVALDGDRNQVVVGRDEDLFHSSMRVDKINWLAGQAPELPWQGMVKIRYRHQAVSATLSEDDNELRVVFAEPQRAITPGQFAVFYEDDFLLGGGVIALKKEGL